MLTFDFVCMCVSKSILMVKEENGAYFSLQVLKRSVLNIQEEKH